MICYLLRVTLLVFVVWIGGVGSRRCWEIRER